MTPSGTAPTPDHGGKKMLVLCIFSILPIFGAEKTLHRENGCAHSNPGKQLSCLKARYREIDTALNRLYKHLKMTLPVDHAEEMKQDSRQWIGAKEYTCHWQYQMRHPGTDGQPEATVDEMMNENEYLQCLIGFTVARVAYLDAAYGGTGVQPGLAGYYDDGNGGSLVISAPWSGSEDKKDTLHFRIEVVRGPTAHLGEIEGDIIPKNGIALFEITEPDAGVNCKLNFRWNPHHIEIKEENCSYYHGVRAFFDGKYRKVK